MGTLPNTKYIFSHCTLRDKKMTMNGGGGVQWTHNEPELGQDSVSYLASLCPHTILHVSEDQC